MKVLSPFKASLCIKQWNLPIALVIAGGVVLRMYGLGTHDLWHDETCTIAEAECAPFSAYPILGSKLDWSPPLYFILMRLWLSFCSLFNHGLRQSIEWVMRFPSALFSSATLILFYLFARTLINNRTGTLLSLFFLAASPFHLWYAQEARPYALSVFLTLLSTYFFYAFLAKGDKKNLVGYVFSATASLYTDYMSILVVIIYGIFSGFQSKPRIKNTLIALLPLCFFLPWFFLLLRKFLFVRGGFWVPLPTAVSLLITIENFVMGYNGSTMLYRIADLLVICAAVMICRKWNSIKERSELFFCILLCVLPIMVFFVGSRFCSGYLDRLFIICTPYFYLLIAWAIAGIPHNYTRGAVMVTVMVAVMIAAYRYYHNEMYRSTEVRHHMGTYLKKPIKPLVQFLADNLGEHDYLWWGNISCTLPSCVYAQTLPAYQMPCSRIESLCSDYPAYQSHCRDSQKEFRQHAFFVFAPGIINTSLKRPYTHEVFRNSNFFISLEDALARLERRNDTRIFFLGYDWARSGALDENSSRLKEFLDASFPCKEDHDFDGIHLYIYEIEENSQYGY